MLTKQRKHILISSLLGMMALLSVCCSSSSSESQTLESLSQYVDPRIGTAHCRWFHFAPGALPFGLAKPAAATNAHVGNKSGWEATGYDYRDKSIEGFPCLHEFQVGGIVLMPTVGELKTVPGGLNTSGEGYRSTFDRKDEEATAGYYSVLLKDYDVKAELTATNRVAYQRFTFPESDQSRILFDIGNRQGDSGPAVDAQVRITDDGLIEGWVETLPEYVKKYQSGATVTMYFSAQLDKTPTSVGTFKREEIYPNTKDVSGVGSGAYLTFATEAGEAITAKVGLSYTSVDNARLNRETEATVLTFDDARVASQKTWDEYLGRIRVETPVKEDKVKFYTGLYHAILGRGLANDVNGAYPKHDGTVGQLPMKDGQPAFNFYNTDGIWGGQWNLLQVWALAYPEYLSDYVSTHIQVYKDSGWLGDGIACSRYISGVGTNQLSLVINAAYQCGIRDFDIETGYDAIRKNEMDGDNRPLGAGKTDTKEFVKYGYVPHRETGEWPDETWMFSSSHTLEYSFGCWAAAQMAKELGQTEDYQELMRLSKGWERLYNSKLNLIQPKYANGEFIENFDPLQVWRSFQEGNSWQYTFYVPHDAKTLVGKMGAEEFTARLDSIFSVSQKMIFSGGKEVIDAFSGLETLYNHGNQPCLHISWLFNESERPSLTQKWVRAILDEFYGTDGIHGYGYGQDEDQGQLGAWYAIASLGIFDVKGLNGIDPSFALGSPIFDKITIQLSPEYYSGETFVIETHNNSKRNVYADEYLLDGEPYGTLRIPFSTITSGGHLEVKMSDTPKDIY